MNDHELELLQFSYSHYNEKVRWALDFKKVPHRRTDYLPGPHIPQIRKLTGQTQVPVMRIDGRVVAGSAAILGEIEELFPTPPLYPAGDGERRAALDLQAEFDDDLGPEVRLVFFDATLDAGLYAPSMFAVNASGLRRAAYLASFPLARIVMKRSMNVTPERAAVARTRVAAILDRLAGLAVPSGFLVGSAFSVADLTAVSLLGPILDLDHPDMKKPEPYPPRLRAVVDEWSAHPAVRWAHGIYRAYRPLESAAHRSLGRA